MILYNFAYNNTWSLFDELELFGHFNFVFTFFVMEAEYIQHRIQLFEALKAKADVEIAAHPRESITVTMPDGRLIAATSWETTPLSIAVTISKSLAERIVIAKVDGALFDLTRPLESSCALQFLDFEHEEGKRVFWHSSAHVLGEACELNYGCHLCIGPPIEEGFYYEMATEKPVLETDYESLNILVKKAVTEKQLFQRLVITKPDLLEMFKVHDY